MNKIAREALGLSEAAAGDCTVQVTEIQGDRRGGAVIGKILDGPNKGRTAIADEVPNGVKLGQKWTARVMGRDGSGTDMQVELKKKI